MADDTGTTETETSGPTTAELAARQDTVEGKLDKILEVLGKGEGKAQGAAAEHERTQLNEPTSVADEIRRQLEERDAADQAKKKDETDQEWRNGVDAKLGGLTEKTPEPPRRKIEKIMWGA